MSIISQFHLISVCFEFVDSDYDETAEDGSYSDIPTSSIDSERESLFGISSSFQSREVVQNSLLLLFRNEVLMKYLFVFCILITCRLPFPDKTLGWYAV